VAVSCRRERDEVLEDLDWQRVSVDTLASSAPWRTFRWYYGQRHYSGSYWSARVQDHVIYESRLELSHLLFADFDPSVSAIVAQPFLLRAVVEGKERRHIPDYLLITNRGPVVVDVKPLHRLKDPVVEFTFRWTRQAVEERGWDYWVCSEPPTRRLENVRFLAGYRRSWLFDAGLLDAVRSCDPEGLTIAQAARAVSGRPEELARAAMLHLLWSGEFTVDIDEALGSAPIRRAEH
jgi:hypothetical protein